MEAEIEFFLRLDVSLLNDLVSWRLQKK